MIINEIVPAKVAFPPATDVNGTVAAPQTTEEESLHPASIQQQRGAPSAGYTIQLGKKVREDFKIKEKVSWLKAPISALTHWL